MMRQRKKSAHLRQNRQSHFRDAYLVVSGTMLLCELLLLAVLCWKHPSLAQSLVPVLLLLSGAVLMPLFLGVLAHSARTPSRYHEEREEQQNTHDLLQ